MRFVNSPDHGRIRVGEVARDVRREPPDIRIFREMQQGIGKHLRL